MSRRPWFLVRALAWTALVASGVAHATPPDHLSSSAQVLCSHGDRVALLLRTMGNAGTYYITDTQWYLVMVDAASGDVQWRDHGAVVVNTVNLQEQGDAPEVSYRVGDAPPLGRSLQEWGMMSCGAMDATHVWGAEAERFGLAVSEAGVFVTLSGRRREIEIAGTWDPSVLSEGQFPWSDGPPRIESQEPISYLGNSVELILQRTLPLATRTVFVVRLISEFGSRDMVIASPRTHADRAMAYLVNARGMDDHSAGRVDHSAIWFATALNLDPSFDTARYNLACALARQGDATDAVRHLQLLPATAELATKIAEDADFDSVRSDEGLVDFVRGLP